MSNPIWDISEKVSLYNAEPDKLLEMAGANNNAHVGATCFDDALPLANSKIQSDKLCGRLLEIIQKPLDLNMTSEVLSAPRGPPPHHLKPLTDTKFITKRQKEEMLRISELRADQPYLSRTETYEYRNTYYQNLCLNIIKEGYHRTFSELFSLVSQQEKARHAAGPDSVLWNIMPLNLQPEKLILLRDCLSRAEDCTRREDYTGSHEAYRQLAEYFVEHPDDKWLADHFYSYCLQMAIKITDDGRFKAEAHLRLGLAIEKNGGVKEALEHLKEFYRLSAGKDWVDSEEHSRHLDSCQHLARVFTAMAESLAPSNVARVAFLKDAHEMAKESGNKKLEGQCGYRLGLAYEQLGNPDTALLYLREFYELSKAIHDDENLGLACEAMAKAFERQGQTEKSIAFLEEFVEVTERSEQKELHSRACRDIGAVYNSLHNYAEAAKYFSRAFTVASSLQNTLATNNARVLCGVAGGNGINGVYSRHVDVSTRKALERCVEWKNSRTDASKIFGNPIEDEPSEKTIIPMSGS